MQPEVEALLARLGATARSVSVELHERQQLHLHGEPRRYVAPQLMTSWDTLYRALREPLADVCYHLDSSLKTVQVEDHDVAATGQVDDEVGPVRHHFEIVVGDEGGDLDNGMAGGIEPGHLQVHPGEHAPRA